jgi:hypothetical protein
VVSHVPESGHGAPGNVGEDETGKSDLVRSQDPEAGGLRLLKLTCGGVAHISFRRVAHPSSFYILSLSNTVGASSFACFAKGGLHKGPLASILFASRFRAVPSDSISTGPSMPVA